MEILLFYKMEKKPGNQKRELFTQGEVPVVLMRSPREVWEHPQPLGEHTCMGTPSALRRTHLYGNLLYDFLFVEVAAQ
jgi:hypothetical protein